MQLDEAWRRLNLVQDFIPAGASNRPGTRLNPGKITIHNTDNAAPGADAAAHARYVKGPDARKRQVSWHFTVDDKAVFQSLPTNEVGWHAGPGNRESIGIEICMNAGMDVAAAYERAALLTALMARQLGVPVTHGIVQHNTWTGKNCPRVLRESPNGWSSFLRRVQQLHGSLRDVYAASIELTAVADDCCEPTGKKSAAGTSSPGRQKSRSSAAKTKGRKSATQSVRKPARAKTRKRKTTRKRKSA